jgi:hypothetical protein
LEKAFQLLGACLPTLTTYADVIGSMVVVPNAMHTPASFDADYRHVPTGLNVTDKLEVRDDLGAYFVPARRHYPLLKIRSSNP